MMRTFLSFLMARKSHDSRRNRRPFVSTDDVVLFANFRGLEEAPPEGRETTESDRRAFAAPPKPTPDHRARVFSMELRHLKLCSEKRCRRLSAIGIVTAGDLVAAEPLGMTKRMKVPANAEATLRRYQQAIRLAASVPGLMPQDAMLLVAIHRRTTRALAIESPAMLHRDMERFALSSRGQRELRGRRLPSLRRVRKWIEASTSLQLAG